MKKLLVFILALIAGISISVEGAIGGVLGQHIGELEASYYVFLVGAILFTPFIFFYRREKMKRVKQLPKWQLTGGFLGATYLVLLFISVMHLGVGVAMTSVIIGQMVVSIFVDHFGWFGVRKISFNRDRFIAVALLICSLFLVL
ncbi:MAG TPA: DMT family transporter [Pseudogracilibacillus sp.]|nr:DMT family transporter [Pseudogracilibacillus sp.]